MGAVCQAADALEKQGEKWDCPYRRASRSILPVPLGWGFPEEARHERFVGHAAGGEDPRVVCAKARGGKELLFSES